jgi:regulator of replication initiation timing
MAGDDKKGAAKGKPVGDKTDKRRLGYLKIRAKEMKHEMQALKAETNALREKLGMGAKAGKGKKKSAAAEDDGDDE